MGAYGLLIGIVGLYFANRERKTNRAKRAAISANPVASTPR